MTVSNQTLKSPVYVGNGATVAFATTFHFQQEEDLKVLLDGVELTLGSDYTVTGENVSAGGTVTLAVAPATGTELIIIRDIAPTQGTDYEEGTKFPALAHENALDKLTMLYQQLLEVTNRAVSLPVTSELSGLEIPDNGAAANIGKMFAYDGTGEQLTLISALAVALTEALTVSNGFVVQTSDAATYTARTNTGTANEITVTNGSGVSGNPTYSLPSALTMTGKTLTGGLFNGLKGTDIASAATTDLSTATTNFVDITGTTTITALGTMAAGTMRWVKFTGALTLTHHATSLILPGAANITTAAGDTALFVSLGSGNWQCMYYTAIATGTPLAATQAQQETGTSTAVFVSPGRQQSHPSASKAQVHINGGTGAILFNFNITSVTRTGTGVYDIVYATDFSSAQHGYVWGADDASIAPVVRRSNVTAGGCTISVFDVGGTPRDVSALSFTFFGDQ